MKTFMGYIYVVVAGLVLLAAAVFLALQWDLNHTTSTFSAYGPNRTVPTAYLIVASAAGGLALYWTCRLMVRGVNIVWKARREQERIRSEIRQSERRSDSAGK